ncbi:MAG: trigger factor [Candidatus Nomurabacteria bacterium]|jgi:trigger factor|nr:trigger factor [Candidatus Nomurabacteria bacterium]
MKYTRKNLAKNKTLFTVVNAADELKAAQRRAIARLGKDVKVPGFRAGKAPENILAMHIGANRLADEVINDVINGALVEILTAEQIQPLDRPNVKVTKFVPFDTLEYTIEIEVVPPVKLGGYMNLKAKREKVAVIDQDVENVIEQLRAGQAEKKVVKRAAADGDEVVLDFTGTRDGKPFDGGQAEEFPLTLGSKSFIPGFEEAIAGHKTGEEFEVPLTFPKKYHAPAMAGAKVIFKVKIHKVSEIKKPTVDEKFAAKIGAFKTVKELKDDIRRELTQRAEFETTEKWKSDLLAELVKKSTVEAPEVLVADQLHALEEDFKNNLKYRGLTAEQYFAKQGFKDRDEWLDEELRPQAETRVMNGLILSELARAEKIEASDEEIDARQQQIVEQYNDPKLVKRFNSPEFRRDLANRIVTEKALGKLVAYNS